MWNIIQDIDGIVGEHSVISYCQNELVVNFRKYGTTLTKNIVKRVIAYLKESSIFIQEDRDEAVFLKEDCRIFVVKENV